MMNCLTTAPAVGLALCLALAGASYVTRCNRAMFDAHVQHYCILPFAQSVEDMTEHRLECPWPAVNGPYVILTACLERAANASRCLEPTLKDAIFLRLHDAYFSLCSRLEDPATGVLLLLALPCVVTTFLLPVCCISLTTANTNIQP